jgi:multidrug efflux system membrane fusion protein
MDPMFQPRRPRCSRAQVAVGLGAAVLLLLAACSPSTGGGGAATPGPTNAPAARPGRGALTNAPVPVWVTNVVAQDVPVLISGIGNVHPFSTVSVKSRVVGELARIGFRQGDEVRAGDLIFLIDPRPLQASLDLAKAVRARDQAGLVKAQADLRRADELRASQIVAESDYEQSWANVDALKATVAADAAAITNAEVQLGFCTIASPITGRIGTLLVNQGNIVKDVDTVLAVINQLRPIYVDFSVPEQFLPALRERQKEAPLKVEVAIPGDDPHHAEGTLVLINNQVDQDTGSILLRAEFPNEDELLWPGQFVKATLTLAVERGTATVPSASVQLDQTGQHVCVVRPDDTVEMRAVEVGQAFGGVTIVTKGLRPGERIVTSGQLRLVEGSRVKVVGGGARPGA